MKFTFEAHISQNAGRPGLALLGENARSALLSLCAQFPYDAAADFGFESRLGSEEAACDFFLLIRRASEGARMVAGESPVSGLGPALQNHPFWKRMAALFREWNAEDSYLHRNISSFWLEFDFQDGSYDPVPNLFFQIDHGETPVVATPWDFRIEKLLDRIYGILFDVGFPRGMRAFLQQCVEALPDGAILYQTGFMIPRKAEAVRLVLSRITLQELDSFLQRTGWPGDTRETLDQISRYGNHFRYTLYDLTLGKGWLPSLGTELFFQDGKQPLWDAGWSALFADLGEAGLLLPGKRADLVNFCGKTSITRIVPTTYYHGINHLKLVSRPGKAPEWKAYFGTVIVPSH